MDDKNIRYDLTSADSKVIGFEFQYFYFIYKLLQLQEGEKVGYESKEDVHIETNGSQILYQLKHTINKKADGTPENLTDLDIDLWKTISHWVNLILQMKKDEEQLEFIKNTEFVLATNKNIKSNKFVLCIQQYHSQSIKFSDVVELIDKLLITAKSDAISNYLDNIKKLSRDVLEKFFNKIEIVDTGDDIIKKIKSLIMSKMIHQSRVNDVFNSLLSELKQDFFYKVKDKSHQEISFDEWIKKYSMIFENNRSSSLPIRKHTHHLEKNPLDKAFVKELIEIGDVREEDIVQISNFMTELIQLEENVNLWHTDGLLTYDEIDDFHDNSISIWKNSHRKSHRSTIDDESDKNNALSCLDEIRDKELKIKNTELQTELSNGEFYFLSDKQRIGWKNKWKEKYK